MYRSALGANVEVFDVSDKSWKRELYGRWPLERFTRADLAVELRLRQLNPHEAHLVVEGETEHLVCRLVLEDMAGGPPLNELGISMQELQGVGNLRHAALRAVKTFPRFLVLIADKEGDMEREVNQLIAGDVLKEDAVRLWDTSFEEANFSDEELIDMIAELGSRSDGSLTLDAGTLRARYSDYRDRVRRKPLGVAEYALGLAESPEFGSVRVSKTDLAPLMAERILDDLRELDVDEVSKRRPIVDMLVTIFRVI